MTDKKSQYVAHGTNYQREIWLKQLRSGIITLEEYNRKAWRRQKMIESLTDDELGQIRELVRLTGIPFEELEEAWRYNKGKKSRFDDGTF